MSLSNRLIPGAAGLRGRRPIPREQIAKDKKSLDGHMRGNCEEEDKTAKKKGRIAAETLKKVQIRKARKEDLNNSRTRAGKAEGQKRYTIANKDVKSPVKSSIRREKAEFCRKSCKTGRECNNTEKNMKELYETTRKLSGKRRKNDIPVTVTNGRTLTRQEEQLELLNRPPPAQPADIPPASHPLPINTSKSTRTEIRNAIKRLKTGKAPGPDSIPPEAIKGT